MFHPSKLRRQITCEAARLIHERRESEFHRARLKAARRICRGWVKSQDLPSDIEIRDELQALARLQDHLPVTGVDQADHTDTGLKPACDRFQVFESLLLPLENVKLSPKYHPEGDALYHSLQVFDLAREELSYDEEFLLAALLHDVGKAIDPLDHVTAALGALEGTITERTAWLIEFHTEAKAVLGNTIGIRAHRRLRESEDYHELVLLARCDRLGRQAGVPASDIGEALDFVRDLAESNG